MFARPHPRALFLLCSLALPVRGTFAAPAGAVHVVEIEAMQFTPADLVVKAGDTVIWKNKDPFPHTVTALGKQFNSKDIAVGASWKMVAARRGAFDYLCTRHRTMKATLTVR